jgi:hypothetical protein
MKLHATIDYIVSVLFIALPWLLDFNDYEPPAAVLASTGIGILAYTTMTTKRRRTGLSIDNKTHLQLDFTAGCFLLIAPWLFDFHFFIYKPFLIAGSCMLLIAALSKVMRDQHHKFHVSE